MNDSHHRDLSPGQHLDQAIAQANQLIETRPTQYSAAWLAQSSQVGDLSVLLLALRD